MDRFKIKEYNGNDDGENNNKKVKTILSKKEFGIHESFRETVNKSLDLTSCTLLKRMEATVTLLSCLDTDKITDNMPPPFNVLFEMGLQNCFLLKNHCTEHTV